MGDEGETFGKNRGVSVRGGWDTRARQRIVRGWESFVGKYWMFLLYPSKASAFDHCQRMVWCAEPLWVFFCLYLSFYSHCERVKVCPRVVSWQRRTKSSAKERNMEIA